MRLRSTATGAGGTLREANLAMKTSVLPVGRWCLTILVTCWHHAVSTLQVLASTLRVRYHTANRAAMMTRGTRGAVLLLGLICVSGKLGLTALIASLPLRVGGDVVLAILSIGALHGAL